MSRVFTPGRGLEKIATVLILAVVALAMPRVAGAEPVEFNIPAQAADRALLAFSKQARVDVLFSYDNLRAVRANAVVGRYEPQEALGILLRGTAFTAQRNGDSKWVITPTGPPAGTIKGKMLAPDGFPARRVRVVLVPAARSISTDADGQFEFQDVRPGRYRLLVTENGFQPLQITDVMVKAREVTRLQPHVLQRMDDPTRMEPFVVQGQTDRARTLDHSETPLAPRTAGGNLDLSRTESDALPYMIFNRTQIARSGVVNLNEFLQRELIDSSAATTPPEQDGTAATFRVGSSNLSLRGFQDQETVILINGRPLPEVMLSGSDVGHNYQPPDVNFIPLSLVQQVEVLPVSASAIYSGNAVGGVINIVLRPDVDANATEVTATYTNAMGHYDAPQSSLSLLNTQALLKGALRIRLNASLTRSFPATEAELGYHQRRFSTTAPLDAPIFRATPNVRSIVMDPVTPAPDFGEGAGCEPPSVPNTSPPGPVLPGLFGPGTAPVTSVAPGADGTGGIEAFRGREGVRNLTFFKAPGALSTSPNSLGFPYGREQSRATYYGSAVYDATPWLQLALDGTYSNTVMHRGFDVFPLDLKLGAGSPFNPFGRDVHVSLNETALALGEHYSEARVEFGALVLGAIVKLGDWRMTFDGQYAHNVARYRGIQRADQDRVQSLVDAGLYNPLRDTQRFGPPQSFYDQALVYRGGYGRFVTIGNYETLDLALRTTDESLPLPTGTGVVNVGTDFRRNHLAKYNEDYRYADGTLAGDPLHWGARTLSRYSFFGEFQAPLYPAQKLPRWLRRVQGDLGLRYVAAADSKESNFAPTYATKVALTNGLSLRASVTTSNRFPTPQMNRLTVLPDPSAGGGSPNLIPIFDPVRQQSYDAVVTELINPDLRPENAVTQTGGIVFERGSTHRFRAAIDFVDTHKVNEIVYLDWKAVLAGERFWPERVQRAPAGPGDPPGGGLITQVVESRINLSSRYSQDWTGSFDYVWNKCFGGTLEAYARVLYFQRYKVRAVPNESRIDELNAPDGLVPLLRYRANAGLSWSTKTYAFGTDAHYFHSQLLPVQEWAVEGHDRIRPYWQFDTFAQVDLARWLPWYPAQHGLRLQARVNNVLNAPFPKYLNDGSGAGVRPYGDWRGRVYSLSLTATF
jgi:outer membrane receptor protein involved in Fe transport